MKQQYDLLGGRFRPRVGGEHTLSIGSAKGDFRRRCEGKRDVPRHTCKQHKQRYLQCEPSLTNWAQHWTRFVSRSDLTFARQRSWRLRGR